MVFLRINYRSCRLLIIAFNVITVIAIFGLLFNNISGKKTSDPINNTTNNDNNNDNNNARIELDLKYQIDDMKKIKLSLGKEITELEGKRNFLIKEIKKFEEIMEHNFALIADSKKNKII
jgi:hypothetical protein